jgi:exonuclease SbcC
VRPVRLVAEGFTAFRDRTEIDFSDAEFFVLFGPTGSGKSSVLDAICIALYGSVPRYDDDRLVAPAITQGAAEARVSLTFAVDGAEYVATRVVRRTKTGATTKEARLERGADVLAGDARAMSAAVSDLIGLPFRHFTQCVVLPQGEFAEFLHDKPSQRQELLVKLLDLGVYGRMLRHANTRAAEIESSIMLDQQRLDDLSECTPEAEASARAAVGTLETLRTELEKGETEIRALEQSAEQAGSAAAAARDTVRHLEAVKVPAAVRRLGDRRDGAAAARDEARTTVEAAQAAFARHTEEVDRLPDPAPLQIQVDAYDQLDACEQEIGTLEASLRDAEPALDAARAALDTATHALAHAEQEYDAAVEDTAATKLAATLKVGEPCPVCEQIVAKKPRVRAGEKARALKARDAAREQVASAQGTLDKLVKGAGELTAEMKALERQRTALRRKVTGAPAADVLAKQIEEIRAAQAQHRELQRALDAATSAERDAAKAVADLDRAVAAAREQCDAQRDPLVRAGLEPPVIGTDVVASWTELATWAVTALPAKKKEAAEQAKVAEREAGAVETALERLVALCEAAGVAVPLRPAPTVSGLRERAAAALQQASAGVQRIAAGIEESAAIGTRIAAAREQADIAKELARHLHSNRFEKWIVNEALASLVDGASSTLEQLSGGQYALGVDEDNEFTVVDHRNADERRSVKTLSGGETFQASLALALALADHVGALAAGGAAKLDAIFLDEGFGTLDAESLDTVAATLETLGHAGRMVGIVTHVRELADRVPVRYEVLKNARSATVTRADT